MDFGNAASWATAKGAARRTALNANPVFNIFDSISISLIVLNVFDVRDYSQPQLSDAASHITLVG
jgi:hypothetical protein